MKSCEKALWGRWRWNWNLKDGLLGFPRKEKGWNEVGKHQAGQRKGPKPNVHVREEECRLTSKGLPGHGMTAVRTKRSFHLMGQ